MRRGRRVSQRKKAGISNAKVNRETELLGRAFKLAIEDAKLSYCPKIPALPEHNARQGFFEHAEFEAVAEHLPETIAEAARFAYRTGWRRSEAIGLRWEHVDRSAHEVRSQPRKAESRGASLSTRPVGSHGAALDRSGVQGAARRVGALPFRLPSRRPPTRELRPRLGGGVQGGEGSVRLFHDLRRTAVRDMIRAGVPQVVAKKISGHETDSVFERYNIVSEEDRLDALRRRQSYLDARDEKHNVVSLRAVNSDKDSDK